MFSDSSSDISIHVISDSSENPIVLSSDSSVSDNPNGLLTQKNKQKRLYNGHRLVFINRYIHITQLRFNFDKLNSENTRKFWYCDRKFSDKCKVWIHYVIGTNQVVKQLNAHSHGTDPTMTNVLKIKKAVKDRAESTMEVYCFFIIIPIDFVRIPPKSELQYCRHPVKRH